MRFIFLILIVGLKANAALNIMPPYAQGTWTPIIFLSTSQPSTVTYATQAGTYTRFGDLVCVQAYIALSAFAAGSGAGNVYVSGTPFSTVAPTAPCGGVTVTAKSNWITSGPAFAQCLTSGAQALELLVDGTTTISNLTRANVTTNTVVSIEGCYRTAQ